MSAPRPRLHSPPPAWLRLCAWVLVTLVVARAAALVDHVAASPAPAFVADAAPLDAPIAFDDDGGEDALAEVPSLAPPDAGGAAVASLARCADAVGSDPPGVPPPEA